MFGKILVFRFLAHHQWLMLPYVLDVVYVV
jgi:hypothetical protein